MPSEFGAFRTTPATRVRPPRATFRPIFRVDEATQRHLLAIEAAERDLKGARLDEANERRLVRDALSRNAFGTVSIEGNPITLAEVESLLLSAPSPANATGASERDVLNLAAFLARLDDHASPREPHDLERLHALLFDGTVREPGRFKDAPNFIGRRADRTVVYVPTPPERVDAEMRRALDWFHAANEHPLVRIAVFFHELQSIHPFLDGNGRLGRAVAALQMHRLGYEGVRYATIDYAINHDREAYYDALARTQGGTWDLTAWVAYWVRVVRAAYDDAVHRVLLQGAIPPGLHARALDVAVWFARAARVGPARRVKVADVHAAFPDIPRRTLQRDLAALVEARVLDLEGRGRGASYGFCPPQ